MISDYESLEADGGPRVVQLVKILDLLNQILEKSPGTRVFVTGRHHVQAQIEKRLTGRVISVSVSLKKEDIIRYLRSRLSEDEMPNAMDEILEKIPENISEMCVGAMVLRILH